MLKYVKEVGKNKFVLFHTINGKIRMKQSAREAGTITNNKSDTGTGNWLIIDSPDDLFKYEMNIDFDKLNYTPLKFNIECSAKSDFKYGNVFHIQIAYKDRFFLLNYGLF